jgi:hypothetical protein
MNLEAFVGIPRLAVRDLPGLYLFAISRKQLSEIAEALEVDGGVCGT